MPRRRTSRKAKRSRRTRRRNQRGGDAPVDNSPPKDAIVGSSIQEWLRTDVAGIWTEAQWKTKPFYEEGWPLLEVKNYSSSDYEFTLPKHHPANIYSLIDVAKHPGSLGDPKTADEYKQYLMSLKEQPDKPLPRYVNIENILRNIINVDSVTEDTILMQDQPLLLWFVANAVKDVPEDAIVGFAPIPNKSSSTDSSEQPALLAIR